MKHRISIIVFLAFSAMLLTGCVGKYKKVSVSSVELESVTPTSLRSCNAVIAVQINNPAPSFKLKDIEATVKRNGDVFGTVTADPVALDGKCERVYRLPLQAQLAEGIGVVQLLALYKGFKPEEFTIDVKARADVVGKVGKDIEYNDVPLSKLMKK